MRSRLLARWHAWRFPLTSAATLLCGLLFLVLDVPLIGAPLAPVPHREWLRVAVLVAGCIVLLAKARAPFLVLGASAVLFAADLALGGSIGMVLVLFDAVYSAALFASDRGRRVLLGVIASATVAGIALVLALTRDLRSAAFTGLQLFAVVGTPYWWGLAVQRERDRTALAAQRADDLERLAVLTQQSALREERRRMAHDLHDAIASELSAIAIHTEAALAAASPSRSALETIRGASVRSLEQMRSMILVLHSSDDAPAAPDRLSDAPRLLERARARGLDVRLVGTVPALPVTVDQAAGRILQESLTNAMKHASGARVTAEVRERAATLWLRIISDPPGAVVSSAAGRPASPSITPPSAGLGVRMMRERAEALGGSLTAGTGGDGRWTVTASLPLRS